MKLQKTFFYLAIVITALSIILKFAPLYHIYCKEQIFSLKLPTCELCDGFKPSAKLVFYKEMIVNNQYEIGLKVDTSNSEEEALKTPISMELKAIETKIAEPNPIKYKPGAKPPFNFTWIVSPIELGDKKMRFYTSKSEQILYYFKDVDGVKNDILDNFYSQIQKDGYITFDYKVLNPVGLNAQQDYIITKVGELGFLVLIFSVINLFSQNRNKKS